MMLITPGQKFGRWTVLDDYQKTIKGEKKWRCRCKCGTERYVLERSLRHGGSMSCGCLRIKALHETIAHNIAGQTFGELTVLEPSDTFHRNGGVWWKCRCSCGNVCELPATVLVKGRRTHCASKVHEKNYYYTNIEGQRFGRLVACYRTDKRDTAGSVIWHCQCDCGKAVEVSYNCLMYSNQRSCGCQKKEHDQLLGKLQTRVDGTSLDIIKSKKIPTDNTTGYRGVYLIKGKYVAKLVFQKKAYYLGTFENIEDAHKARLEAEAAVYQPTMEFYEKWQKKAKENPEWAEENPMQIFVKNVNGRLYTEFTPTL